MTRDDVHGPPSRYFFMSTVQLRTTTIWSCPRPPAISLTRNFRPFAATAYWGVPIGPNIRILNSGRGTPASRTGPLPTSTAISVLSGARKNSSLLSCLHSAQPPLSAIRRVSVKDGNEATYTSLCPPLESAYETNFPSGERRILYFPPGTLVSIWGFRSPPSGSRGSNDTILALLSVQTRCLPSGNQSTG